MRFLSLFLLAGLGVAQTVTPSNPAPMNGIWTLTQFAGSPSLDRQFAASGQLTIEGGRLTGNYGCGRYRGTLEAVANTSRISVALLAPSPLVRCRFAVRGNIVDTLNAATQYTLSRDHLVLFSKAGRLSFERIGFVTPGKK
ncbi:META domain-containing protein [Deinococcus sp.]|uniref:META domain-containing protein n=1 Tax=Deinococcus sp. TaxID=47478 RepID=UPI0025FD7753|nr:META domain-containing protein [Deinococcus sp.]